VKKSLPAAAAFRWCLLFLLVAASAFAPVPAEKAAHPFYVSVIEVQHNAKEKTLEISCRIFSDDLEATLKKHFGTAVDLSAEKDRGRIDKMIPDYISKTLHLQVDGKPAALQYIGYEKDKESAYSYFEVSGVPAVHKLDVETSLLHDLSEEQINIFHVTVNGKRQSQKLNFPQRATSFQF